MPEKFLSLAPGERREILSTMAAALGRVSAVLEKDVWVCWVLEHLFQMPGRIEMAFKGGTSLSKVFKVIDRFSEDVDVTLDYRALQARFEAGGFDPLFDPFRPGVSRSQRDNFKDALRKALQEHVHQIVGPYFRELMASGFSLGPDSVVIDKSGEKLRIHYPSALENHDYLGEGVLIEFGGRNPAEPCELHTVVPYLAEGLPDLEFPAAQVMVLSASRTFWEKATLIHAESSRESIDRSVDRLSRHWYDLALLGEHPIGARAMGADLALLNHVVEHKKMFFPSGPAKYDDCLRGQMRLVPEGRLQDGLRDDYRGMQDMIRGEALTFDQVIERLRALEFHINGLFL